MALLRPMLRSVILLAALATAFGCGGGGSTGGGGTQCTAGQIICAGACVDPLADHDHCGADASCNGGTTCGQGQVCNEGTCATSCPAGQVVCGDRCVDPLTDRNHCGADTSCQGFTACQSGQICAAGTCATSCPSGQYACDGKCIDPATDRAYCGADASCHGFTTCTTGDLCIGGVCSAASCPASQYACGGKCIDPATDPNYCGAASNCTGGHVCGTGSFCNAGSCWSPCGSGLAFCDSMCVTPSTNRGFCGASGLCAGAASGYSCAADHVCQGGSCACPAGQTLCSGACRYGACGAAHPAFEWKASVPLTTPPHFAEPSTVLAHIVFDGTNMVDQTGHTTWTKVGNPASVENGMWTPSQFASGPFTTSDYWVGTAATRDYLRAATAGLFTACVRYKPGQVPISGSSKIMLSMGKAERDNSGSATPLAGWALMQTHESAGFHYIDSLRGEWALPNGYPLDSSTVPSMEWAWFCAGVNGDPADADLASLRESFPYTSKYPLDGQLLPLQVAPAVTGFPGDIIAPAIGAYGDGSHPLSDGQVYEIIITSDAATIENMASIVERAAGGMTRWVESPVTVTGADGAPHVAPPTTVRVEPDGSVIASQSIALQPQMPAAFDPVTNGQCWGVETSIDDWSDHTISGQVLRWSNARINALGDRIVELWFSTGYMCMRSVVPGQAEAWDCGLYGAAPAGSHRSIQGCIKPDRTMAVYLDGALLSPGTATIPDATGIPHLESSTSTFSLEAVSSRLKVWRVWACQGSNPANCP